MSTGQIITLTPGGATDWTMRKDWTPIAQPPDRHGILAHTPDPRGYHFNQDGRIIIPRADAMGASRGFTPTTGIVNVDPSDPLHGTGGISVDLRLLDKELVQQAAADAGGDPTLAWALAARGRPSPVSPTISHASDRLVTTQASTQDTYQRIVSPVFGPSSAQGPNMAVPVAPAAYPPGTQFVSAPPPAAAPVPGTSFAPAAPVAQPDPVQVMMLQALQGLAQAVAGLQQKQAEVAPAVAPAPAPVYQPAFPPTAPQPAQPAYDPNAPVYVPPMPSYQQGIAATGGPHQPPPPKPVAPIAVPVARQEPQQAYLPTSQELPATQAVSGMPVDIKMPFLTWPPQPPKVKVIFDFGQLGGTHSKKFHHVCRGGSCLSLVYDDRYDGDRFLPPATPEGSTLHVQIPSLKEDYDVVVPKGFYTELGCLDILHLIVMNPPGPRPQAPVESDEEQEEVP